MKNCSSLNICKEVADGVRIYFDFTLSDLLLYNQEREQFEHFRIQQAEPTIKQEIEWVSYLLLYISCVNWCVCVCISFFHCDMHTNRQFFCASHLVKSHTSASTLYVSFFHFFIRIPVNIFLGYKEHCLLLYHNQFVFLCKVIAVSLSAQSIWQYLASCYGV